MPFGAAGEQVVVPFNYPEFTTRRVFVSEWIDGEKLSQSQADDVQDLVNVGVTACEPRNSLSCRLADSMSSTSSHLARYCS